MKTLLGLLLIVITGFTSCEGRKSKNQALAEDIEEFKKTVSFAIDIYKPESYFEREVDTLLHNGFRVKIKTYTDLDNSVVLSKIKDTVNYQTHYRNFKFDILVEKNGKQIFKESYNKEKANSVFGYRDDFPSKSPLHNFHTLGVLQSIEVIDESALKNNVLIEVIYAIPTTDRFARHSLFINSKGDMNMVIVKIQE